MKKLLLFIIVFGLIGGLLWNFSSETKYQSFISQVVDSTATKRINFTVEKGERVKNIGKELETKEIINSAWAFYRYVKESGLGPEIEAGRFLLKQSYTIPEIAEMLTRSSISEVAITIREGLTIKQIDEYLAKEKVLSAGAFGECAKNCELDYGFLGSRPRGHDLEGYLFPDTYYIELEGITAKKVIQKMLNNFDRKYSQKMREDTQRAGFTIHQILTMASIIEKEERSSQNRPLVAGVLWKRYENNIGLGADATIRYITEDWTGSLTTKELSLDSLYNTRKYAGLPPGPITNPGLASIKASIYPKGSEYWYYLHENNGTIRFGKTLEEHNLNKQKYL